MAVAKKKTLLCTFQTVFSKVKYFYRKIKKGMTASGGCVVIWSLRKTGQKGDLAIGQPQSLPGKRSNPLLISNTSAHVLAGCSLCKQ